MCSFHICMRAWLHLSKNYPLTPETCYSFSSVSVVGGMVSSASCLPDPSVCPVKSLSPFKVPQNCQASASLSNFKPNPLIHPSPTEPESQCPSTPCSQPVWAFLTSDSRWYFQELLKAQGHKYDHFSTQAPPDFIFLIYKMGIISALTSQGHCQG